MFGRFLLALVCPPLPLALMHKPVQAAINAALWLFVLFLFYRNGWSVWPLMLLGVIIAHPLIVYDEMRMSARGALARHMYAKRGIHITPR